MKARPKRARPATSNLVRGAPVLLLSLLASCTRGCAHQDTAQPARPMRGCSAPVTLPTPRADLGVRVLTQDTIVVISDPNAYLRSRVAADCAVADPSAAPGSPSDYRYVMAQRYAAKDTVGTYRPAILSAVSDAAHLSVDGPGVGGSPLRFNVWPQAIRELRLPTADETPTSIVTDTAEIVYFSYLKLDGAMKPGETYSIADRWGDRTTFTYDPVGTSWALKVDQVGYLPDAAAKYAYLGAWLGPGGAMDASSFEGQPFQVLREGGSVAFTGVVHKRSDDRQSQGQPLYGETVLELDFSALSERGTFRVFVDGVGASFPFRIDRDALGEAFYTHARGLYHARCAPLSKQITPWARGDGHTTTRRAAFPPDDDDYKDHSADGWGFQDDSGAFAQHTSFEMVKLTATNEVLPGVVGSWHDAADYDRRPYNLNIVGDLSHAYLFFPDNFTDGQLDLPESGNGIPDLVDEAGIGLVPLLRGQAADGRVATWIETTSHPPLASADTAADKSQYYLSLATRNSSLQYAAAAALYARVMKNLGRDGDAAGYLESAARAYAFGSDSSQRVSVSFATASGDRHSWTEPPFPDRSRRFHAALQLSLATGDRIYKDDLSTMEAAFGQELADMFWRHTSFAVADVALTPDAVPDGWSDRARAALVSVADKSLAAQANDAYRKVWYDTNHPYFRLIGWGLAEWIPLRFLVAAWRVTGDERYRTGALLGVDWMHGANPQGRVWTTGLGKNFPMAVLHLPSSVDGFDEPSPGITLFGYAASFPYSARTHVYGLYDDARLDQAFLGLSIPQLPPPWDDPSTAKEAISDVLAMNVPIWRRMTLLENQNPPMTEFSVHETIGPAAAITGALLGVGWQPGESVRARKPRGRAELQDAIWYQPLALRAANFACGGLLSTAFGRFFSPAAGETLWRSGGPAAGWGMSSGPRNSALPLIGAEPQTSKSLRTVGFRLRAALACGRHFHGPRQI